MGLKVNENKTKYIAIVGQRKKISDSTIGEHTFEKIEQFEYLRANVNTRGDTYTEIKRRILLANRCYYGLQKIMGLRHLTHRSKKKIYKTLIGPILTYGCETWTLTEANQNALGVFEKIL